MLLVLVTAFFTLSKIYPRMGPLYSCLERIETLERSAQAEGANLSVGPSKSTLRATLRHSPTNVAFGVSKRGTGQAADKTRLEGFRAEWSEFWENIQPLPTEIANATVVVKPFLTGFHQRTLTHRLCT
jgi:hypothetical protein